MQESVRYPAPGCIVEYLEGNAVQIAMVMEEAGGKLRLFLPNRRETRLTAGRLLPWLGPLHDGVPGKDEMARLLEAHKATREAAAAAVPVDELWELAQGEVETAPARWFAELRRCGTSPLPRSAGSALPHILCFPFSHCLLLLHWPPRPHPYLMCQHPQARKNTRSKPGNFLLLLYSYLPP